jgi:hypothetical protein
MKAVLTILILMGLHSTSAYCQTRDNSTFEIKTFLTNASDVERIVITSSQHVNSGCTNVTQTDLLQEENNRNYPTVVIKGTMNCAKPIKLFALVIQNGKWHQLDYGVFITELGGAIHALSLNSDLRLVSPRLTHTFVEAQ